jgi:hypothetical protein
MTQASSSVAVSEALEALAGRTDLPNIRLDLCQKREQFVFAERAHSMPILNAYWTSIDL